MSLSDWYQKWWGIKTDVAPVVQPGPLPIALDGSLQNPAWSPDGSKIVFTRFRKGYNEGPADVFILDLLTNVCHPIVSDGSDNVSQPGSTWNKNNGLIIFSSDRAAHDEIWSTGSVSGVSPRKMTDRSEFMAYEPSWSSDGRSIVFESHKIDQENNGRIVILAGGQYQWLTAEMADCRQPNWSPRGDLIVYQTHTGSRWELCTYNVVSKAHSVLTGRFPGDKTDATFSPDGQCILYSGQRPEGSDGLMVLLIQGGNPSPVQHGSGYFGAASWSPDGKWIVAETSSSDPGGGPGTKLEIVRAHEL